MNDFSLEGCYFLHGPLGACYVTHMRWVLMSLIVELGLVCLFIPWVCKCSHPRGVPWRGVLCYTYVRGVHVLDSCIGF